MIYGADRDPAHLKVNYFDMADREACKAFFEAHIAQYSSRITHWEAWVKLMRARSDAFLARRLANRPPDQHDAIVEFRVLALDGQIARAKLEVAWARQGLKILASLGSERTKKSVKAPRPTRQKSGRRASL